MPSRLYIFIAGLVGLCTGFLTIHSFLAHSWTSIIFWIIAGLIIVYFSPSKKSGVYAAIVFGFFNIAAWLLSGFQGATSQLLNFSILTLGLSILGGICGAGGAFVFNKIFRR